MSFFEWSTPERRRVDRILPTIPNEIYFHIIDTIAPPKLVVPQRNLKILSNLSCVCRFFANICLPRIYERLSFSATAHRYGDDEYKYNDMLSAQIAAKQPLALALAGVVRLCKFLSCGVCDVDSRAGRLFIAAMSHMKNIREVQFLSCLVNKEHWTALATLPFLEKLEFSKCIFMHDPADLEPKIKVKMSQLCLLNCSLSGRFITAIEMRSLRTCLRCYRYLAFANNDQPWPNQPHFTGLQICLFEGNIQELSISAWNLRLVLMGAPASLETLTFSVDVLVARRIATDILETMSEHRGKWTALSSLRSLTLQLRVDDEINVGPVTIELPQSINDDLPKVPVFLGHLQGPASSLRHVNYFGTDFRLVDGEWV